VVIKERFLLFEGMNCPGEKEKEGSVATKKGGRETDKNGLWGGNRPPLVRGERYWRVAQRLLNFGARGDAVVPSTKRRVGERGKKGGQFSQ